ncbi:MAG: type II secretion system F family protein [Methanomethylovorans sp.]|jgi:flagellar protein FlaJ|nr:type II secretion system F family protein [Methanomethylovorans sp.]
MKSSDLKGFRTFNIEKYRFMAKRYAQVLTIRYNLKREYITLGIPVFLAICIILAGVLTGHGFATKEISGQGSEMNSRKDAYEKFLEEMAAQEAAERGEAVQPTAPVPKAEDETDKAKDDLDHIMVYALLIAIIPYSFDSYMQKKLLKRKEVAFSEFLYKLSELMRGGIDPVKGVVTLSRTTELGAIAPNVQEAASAMLLGSSFEDAMHRMARSINSKLVSKYINIVVQAAYTGGNVADLLFRTSEDMRVVIAIDKDKEANLKQYIVIFYLAQGIIIALTYILSTSLLPLIQGVGLEMLGGNNELSDINFERGFFHMIILNALFGGLIVGMITEGEIKHGLKHSAVLVALSYIACITLILSAGSGAVYNISLVSGEGQQAIGGLPLQEPLVFNVTDMSGNPAPGVYVQMSISPSGIVSSAMTEKDGTVTITPTVGEEPGTYVVTATAGNSLATATIEVIG